MPDAGHIARVLRLRRAQLGLSQEAAAQKIHVSVPTYSRWERGLNLPGPDNAQAIAQAFDVPLGELLPEQHDEPMGPTLIEAFAELQARTARLEQMLALALQAQGVELPPEEELAKAFEDAEAASREAAERPAPATPRRTRAGGRRARAT